MLKFNEVHIDADGSAVILFSNEFGSSDARVEAVNVIDHRTVSTVSIEPVGQPVLTAEQLAEIAIASAEANAVEAPTHVV